MDVTPDLGPELWGNKKHSKQVHTLRCTYSDTLRCTHSDTLSDTQVLTLKHSHTCNQVKMSVRLKPQRPQTDSQLCEVLCTNTQACAHTCPPTPTQAAILRLSLLLWGHPAHLLKFSFRALSSREASSEIQEAHAVTHPAAHLKYTMAVSDGLPVALGCLAVGTHVEAECDRWCGRHRFKSV